MKGIHVKKSAVIAVGLMLMLSVLILTVVPAAELGMKTGHEMSPLSLKGELPFAQLQDMVLPDGDKPEGISEALIEEKGHVNRLREQETDLSTVWFQNRDGSKTLYSFSETVKYIDSDGAVRDKRANLTNAVDRTEYAKDYGYVTADNDVRTYFPNRLNQNTGVVLEKGEYTIELTPVSAMQKEVRPNGGTSRKTTVKAIESQPLAGEQTNEHGREQPTVSYAGTFGADTTLRYTPLLNGFKEDIILSSYTGVNEFSFRLNTNGLSLVLEDDACHFIDPATGEKVARVGDLLVYDSKSAEQRIADGSAKSYGHRYAVETVVQDDEYILTIIVDETYLTDKTTVYPVVIDPTYTYSSSPFIVEATLYSGGVIYSCLYVGEVGTVCRSVLSFPGIASSLSYINLSAMTITDVTLSLYAQSSSASSGIGIYEYTGGFNGYGNQWSSANVSSVGTYNFSLSSDYFSVLKSNPSAVLNAGVMIMHTNSSNEYDSNHFKSFSSPFISITMVDSPTSVSMQSSLSMLPGSTAGLSATVNPSGAPQGVSYSVVSSSPSGVVSVNSSTGVVTAGSSAGTATIRAASTFDSTKYADCSVTVQYNPVSSVSMQSTLTMYAVSTANLSATVNPSGANPGVTYSLVSSSPVGAVTGISSSGVVTAGSVAGTATVRATSVADSTKFANCTVTVQYRPVTSVSLPSTLTMNANSTSTLSASVLPAGATPGVTYSVVSSSPFGVVSVNSSTGVVTSGSAAGTATVRATSTADTTKFSNCTVTVQPPLPTSVTMQSTLTMDINSSVALTAAANPSNANQGFTYSVVSSSPAGVVSVNSSSGLVTSGSVTGTATVRATSVADSSKVANCTVTVQDQILTFKPVQIPLLPISPVTSIAAPTRPLTPVCTHISFFWQNHSETQHRSICTVCEDIVTIENHTGSTTSSGANGHTFYCSKCSYQKTSAHTFGSYAPVAGTNNHKRTCTVCGYEDISQHSYNHHSYDSNGHTLKCFYCTATVTEAHTLTLTYIDSSWHFYECECGYNGFQSHVNNFITFNQSGHKIGCACNPGAGNAASHTYNSNNVCTVCGYKNTPCSNGGSHNYTVVVETAPQGHRLGCACDPNNHYIFGEHTFSGNTCTICGYTK